MDRFRQKLNHLIQFCENWGSLSVDPKIKVGCVIASMDMKHILSFGYNGPAAGLPHNDNRTDEVGKGTSGFAHAEANCLIKCPRYSGSAIMIVSYEPCTFCAPLIINCMKPLIKAVVYGKEYNGRGKTMLEAAKIKVVSFDQINDPQYNGFVDCLYKGYTDEKAKNAKR